MSHQLVRTRSHINFSLELPRFRFVRRRYRKLLAQENIKSPSIDSSSEGALWAHSFRKDWMAYLYPKRKAD